MPIITQTFYPISILVKRNQYLKTEVINREQRLRRHNRDKANIRTSVFPYYLCKRRTKLTLTTNCYLGRRFLPWIKLLNLSEYVI